MASRYADAGVSRDLVLRVYAENRADFAGTTRTARPGALERQDAGRESSR
jgi:hypothetical protein